MHPRREHDTRRRQARIRRLRVLLLSQDPASRQRWKNALSDDSRWDVQEPPLDSTTPCPAGPIDVVITDGSLPLPPDTTDPADPHRPRPQVVAIGGKATGHIRLADDHAARDLVQACKLAGRIHRLRRQNARLRVQRAQLRRWALSDPLTGLANRRAWDVETARRNRSQPTVCRTCGLLLLDIDHFKWINDQHGHATGDDVLRRTAELLRARMTSLEFAARLGGDEFGLLLGDIDPASAWDRAEWLRSELSRHAGGPVEGFSLSGGLVVISVTESLDDARYRAASDALRQAKHTGRNRLCQIA